MSAELLLGDARELAAKIDEPVHCVVTDPPFGVAHVSHFGKTDRLKKPIANDEDLAVALELYVSVMHELVPKLADDADLYVFSSWKHIDAWKQTVEVTYPGVVRLENLLIWEKGWPGLGDLEHNWPFSYEVIFYLKKGNRPIKSRRSSILTYDRLLGAQMIHPTEKPIALLQELVTQSTERDELVVDPFAGSGSTLDAARRIGRRALGFELDADHHGKATERLSQQVLAL